MRILHLLEASSPLGLPDGALASIALLQERDHEHEHLLVCFAPMPEIRRATLFGAKVAMRFRMPAHRRRAASIALRRYVDRAGPFDRVQPWSSLAADLSSSLRGSAESAPPIPAYGPVNPDHYSSESRLQWRRRFEISDDEIAITLLDLDPTTSSAGSFGLAIAPLTCAMQDRTFVGLIPSDLESDGATRAERYAKSAGDHWRVELISAPRFAVAIAADVILCPTMSTESDPWRAYSSNTYALACAQACAIPVVRGSFEEGSRSSPASTPGANSAISSRVGLVIALHNASQLVNNEASQPDNKGDTVLQARRPEDWLDRWRETQRTTVI